MTLLVTDLENQLPVVLGASRDPLSTNWASAEPGEAKAGGVQQSQSATQQHNSRIMRSAPVAVLLVERRANRRSRRWDGRS